jgi:hypothetical protein
MNHQAASPPKLSQPDSDAFYEALLDAHQGLTREESEALNARLVLSLANALGGEPKAIEQLMACLSQAKGSAL